jgi:hypothetical protein
VAERCGQLRKKGSRWFGVSGYGLDPTCKNSITICKGKLVHAKVLLLMTCKRPAVTGGWISVAHSSISCQQLRILLEIDVTCSEMLCEALKRRILRQTVT